jgi:hypothetical protein
MLDDLILVRLLPVRSRPPTVTQVARDIGPLFQRPPDPVRVRDAVDGLRAQGAVRPGRLVPTEDGRVRALRFLGMEALPPGWSWRTLRARALPCKVLGLPPTEPESARLLESEDRLTARLLQQRFSLPPGAAESAWTALQAVVCRDLGHPDCTTLEELAAAVLSARIGSERRLSPEMARRLSPRVLLEVSGGVEALRERMLVGWADAAPAPPTVSPTVPPTATPTVMPTARDVPPGPDPGSLAGEILAAARASPTGWFGRDKVLVHHVWRAVHGRTGPAVGLPGDLDGFKQLLVRLNGAGRLVLARADLVQLMDPAELARAEIRVGHATFHFIRAGANRP